MSYLEQVTDFRNKLIRRLEKSIKALDGKSIEFNEPFVSFTHELSEMMGKTELYENEVIGINEDGYILRKEDDMTVEIEPSDLEDIVDIANILDILEKGEYKVDGDESDEEDEL